MFGFANSLELVSDILENTMVSVHASQVIRTLDKIILSLTKSSISEHDKKKLVELGKLHYHFGLKKEYFKVINIFDLKFYLIVYTVKPLEFFLLTEPNRIKHGFAESELFQYFDVFSVLMHLNDFYGIGSIELEFHCVAYIILKI